MKNVNLRALVLLLVALCANAIYAQQAIRINKDCKVKVDDASGDSVALFQNSTLKVEEIKSYVKITEVTSNFDKNSQAGIYQGAELECDNPDETDTLKVRFKDKTDTWRFNVTGVGRNLQIFKKYKVLLGGKMMLVPEDVCSIIDDIQAIDFTEDFSYSQKDSCLHIKSQKDYTVVVNGEETYCGQNQDVTIDKVDSNTTVRVIYGDDEKHYLDCEINVSKMKPYEEIPSDDDYITWIKNNPLIVCVVCVIIILIIVVSTMFFRKKRTKRVSKDIVDKDWVTKGDKNGQLPKESKEINVLELKGKIDDIKILASNFADKLSSIDKALDGYKKQSNIENQLQVKDKEINKLQAEKDNVEKEYKSFKAASKKEKDVLDEKIKQLQTELSEALKVDGAISLNGTAGFVAGIGELLVVGRKTEKVIMDYISQLNDSDSCKFAYFVKRYVSTIDSKKRDRWNSILSTLSIKGYVNDCEAIKYLSAKGCESDEAKLDWLKKFVYEEFLQDYLSALTVMLESIKFSKTYGITQSVKKDLQNDIDILISASKKNGITIHYVQLGKTVNDYANIEIGSKIPNGVEISGKETNVPILVVKYGMSSDKSSKSSKTELVQID